MHVLVVEDDPVLMGQIARMLPPEAIVHRASTRAEAIAHIERQKTFRLALLDVRLGDDHLAGLALLDRLFEEEPNGVRAVITGFADEVVIRRVGVRAFLLTKPFRASDIAVLLVERPARHLERTVMDFAKRFQLTPSERQVLHAFAAGKNTSTIEEELGIKSNTLRNHVHAILEKTGADSRGALIAEVLRAALEREISESQASTRTRSQT